MRNNSKLKVLTLVLMIVLILCFARNTFAAAQITTINQNSANPSISTSTGNAPSNNNLNNIPTNNQAKNNVVQPTNNGLEAPRNLPNTVTNTSIPETGAKSSTMLIGLIIFALVSTVYTYLKIKKYNI